MRKNIGCFVFLLLTLFSCRKTDYNPSVFSEASFPLAVGNWWQYQLTDLIGGGIDTITLKVISVNKSGPYIRFECNFIYNGNVTDSGYFLQSDTSLSFVVSNSYSVSCFNFHFKFPAQTGDKWIGSFPGDTIEVGGVSKSYTLGDGLTLGPCYFFSESYDLPHNFKAESLVLTPKVGLIYQSINFNSDTAGVQVQQSIVLLNYYVQ